MTQKTQLTNTEQLHLYMMEAVEILAERFEYINLSPRDILNVSDETISLSTTALLQKNYPNAKITNKIDSYNKMEFVFGVITIENVAFLERFPIVLSALKECLIAGGLLMLGILNPAADIIEIGNFLSEFGFKDIVLDQEMADEKNLVAYVHAWKNMPSSVAVSQIHRL